MNNPPASEDRTQGTLPDGDSLVQGHTGMTLRDYFAAKAMQSLYRVECAKNNPLSDEDVADCAYSIADDMLKRRQK